MLYDWMHVYCIDGPLERSFRGVQEAFTGRSDTAAAIAVSYPVLHAELQKWQWPKQHRGASNLFETGKWAGTASEALSAVPVLRRYFRDVALPLSDDEHAGAAIASFADVCETIELFPAISRGACTPAEVAESTFKWMQSHRDAHDDGFWALKGHLAGHLPDMLASCLAKWGPKGFLNCWSLERKHKSTNKYMRDIANPQAYERTLAEEITLEHFDHWRQHKRHGLFNPRAPNEEVAEVLRTIHPDAAAILVSNCFATGAGDQYSNGDLVVVHGGLVGELWYHVQIDGECKTCVSVWPRCDLSVARQLATYKVAMDPRLFPSADILGAATFKLREGTAIALWPRWCIAHVG